MLDHRCQRKGKRVLTALLTAILGLVLPGLVCLAADTGSIRIEYHGRTENDREIALTGATFILYRVGTWANGSWNLDGEFAEAPVALVETDASARKQQAVKLYAYAMAQNIKGMTQQTDRSGLAVFEELRMGLYLAAQTEELDRGIEGIFGSAPFLVSLPGEVKGETILQVTVEPKSEWKPLELQKPVEAEKHANVQKDTLETEQSGRARGTKTGDDSSARQWGAAILISAGILWMLGRKYDPSNY